MAVYKLFPEKDTFISSEIPLGNAGRDEIIEIAGYPDLSDAGKTSRLFIQFNNTDIQDIVDTKILSQNYSASLKIYLADSYDLPLGYTLYGYPLSGSWDNGVGKYGDNPTNTTGTSWTYRSAGQLNPWTTSNYTSGVTASFQSTVPGGGTWYTGSNGINLEATQSHQLYSTQDIQLNVTNAVKQHYTASIANNGFVVKLESNLEFNTAASVRLKYFGRDTNTIYAPYLEFKWDDSVYNKGGLSTLATSVATVNITNNRGTYRGEGKQRFRIAAKPKYPNRSFSTTSIYLTNYALPQNSYWGLKDENTEEMVIDFDTNYTKISCDSTGPYFDMYMDGLQPERYYRILVKSIIDGSTVVLDNGNVFKVVRNG